MNLESTITVKLNKSTIDSGDGNRLLQEVNAYLSSQTKLTHKEAVKLFHKYLKENNLVQTPEREKILELIFNQEDAFTTKQIVNNIPNGYSITRRSIYNTINILKKANIIINTKKDIYIKSLTRYFEVNTK